MVSRRPVGVNDTVVGQCDLITSPALTTALPRSSSSALCCALGCTASLIWLIGHPVTSAASSPQLCAMLWVSAAIRAGAPGPCTYSS